MSKLTAAVIGTGFIGPVHVEGLRRAGIKVAGILGSTREKSESACERLGLPVGYESLDHLLDDSSVNVVHITSPNRHHHKQASRALDAGKHVLCEKPLAMNSRESAELVRLADQRGLAAGVNYNIRYYPLCIEARERVHAGMLGDLFHVAGSYVQDWLLLDTDFNWRVISREGGALRAVADIGTHWLDLIQFITGRRVESVCADLQTVHTMRQSPVGGVASFSSTLDEATTMEVIGVETEDYGCVMLRLEGGSRGVMWVSQVTAGRKNCLRFELAGSEQSLAWNSESPNELWIGHRQEPNQTLLRDPALASRKAAKAMSYPGGHNEGFADTFKQLFIDFYASIDSGKFASKPTYPTFADGHHEILACEAILRSHQQQQWVKLGE